MTTHDTLHAAMQGPIQVIGVHRNGWAFNCGCGYRSPLLETEQATREAMGQHAATDAPKPNRHRPFAKKERWPGWPEERRRG